MIINDFCFWNRPKAGMYIKTSKLSAKAGMLLMPMGYLTSRNPALDYVIENSSLNLQLWGMLLIRLEILECYGELAAWDGVVFVIAVDV